MSHIIMEIKDKTFKIKINKKINKIDKEELFKLYMEWVDKVSEDNDWKTSFGPKEIVYSISNIIESNPQLCQE